MPSKFVAQCLAPIAPPLRTPIAEDFFVAPGHEKGQQVLERSRLSPWSRQREGRPPDGGWISTNEKAGFNMKHSLNFHGDLKIRYFNPSIPPTPQKKTSEWLQIYQGVSENVVYPIVPNGFADHEIPSWKMASYFIGNI